MPAAASRSMFGVWNLRFNGVVFVQNGTDVSCQPISSTRKTTMLGLPAVAAGADGSEGPAA